MSILFSVVFYITSVHELEKKPGQQYYQESGNKDPDHEFDSWLVQRATEGSNNLIINLVLLNALILAGGSLLSYFLARRTLRPIETVMRIQDRFITDASHELRTPLTSLLLSNEVALRKKHITENNARAIIQQNVSDIKELKNLSESLLTLATATQGVQLNDVPLQMVLESALQKIRPQAQAKHIRLHTSTDSRMIRTDQTILSEVILVLLDNAIKYSSPRTTVTITTSTDDTQQTHIRVHDQGPGISKNDLPHIFERFYRIDQSRSQTTGHGLGLAIASQLVRVINATLIVEESTPEGSTFMIVLPKSSSIQK
jgi:signal transduction histidine kinase